MDDDLNPDCIDCNTVLSLDHGCEWPSMGPICYGCLADRVERLAAENAVLRDDADTLDEIRGLMDRIDNQVGDSLEKIGEFPSKPAGFPDRIDVACRLLESIPALRAKVERLTPREMTLQDICNVLNKHNHCEVTNWRILGGRVVGSCGYESYSHEDGQYIAQGLERDANIIPVADEPEPEIDDMPGFSWHDKRDAKGGD